MRSRSVGESTGGKRKLADRMFCSGCSGMRFWLADPQGFIVGGTESPSFYGVWLRYWRLLRGRDQTYSCSPHEAMITALREGYEVKCETR